MILPLFPTTIENATDTRNAKKVTFLPICCPRSTQKQKGASGMNVLSQSKPVDTAGRLQQSAVRSIPLITCDLFGSSLISILTKVN